MVRRAGDAGELVEEFARAAGVAGEEMLRMRLLTEETMCMAQTLLPNFEGELWLEGTSGDYRILLEANVREHEESASPDPEVPEGFMAKIAGLLNCSYVFEDVSEMPDRMLEALPEYMQEGMCGQKNTPIWTGEWALSAYRRSLEERRRAGGAPVDLDELEKSIVAQIASDVIVGVHGGKIRLAIVRKPD